MPNFRITMSDTITLRRIFVAITQFKDQAEANKWADEHIDDLEAYPAPTELPIDNTPWEVKVEKVA